MNEKAAVVCVLAFLVAGCLESSRHGPESPTPTPTGEFWPTSGLRLNAKKDFVVLAERPESGLLISQEMPDTPPRYQDIFLRVVDKAGKVQDQVFPLPAVPSNTFHWINFTYPEAPPPFIVVATSGRLPLDLATPKVPYEDGNRSFVAFEARNVSVSFPPTSPSMQVTGPLNASVTFHMNASVIQWVGFIQRSRSDFGGQAGIRTPSGRDLWVLNQPKFGSMDGTLSNGSAPLEVGQWNLWVNGTGTFEVYFEFYWMRDEGWRHYGVAQPRG